MKTLFLFTLATFFLSYNAVQNENLFESEKFLYRGYENVLKFNDLPIQERDIELVGIENVTIKKSDNASYIMYPGAGKTAKIEIRSQTGDVLGVVVFQVRNMPKPELYFCNQKSDNEVSHICAELRVDFPEGSQLEIQANILKWEYYTDSNERSVIGMSSEFDSLANLIRDLPAGTGFTIMVGVEGADSKTRKLSGHWIKK